ncbi:CYS, MET, PRO, and GLY protein 2 [Actinidia rufa]|uniref:U-box domain-containing protein n=1 Tax=Actinidia rufa TaxID=165716 RepID=A0A7J0EXY2_9ERIC|nr:CYS, MET, PRO, and GLY protein 2 [Actinidia rufa]
MGRDDLYISVPTFFKCPISLDVMKSPVSLCTGVTYDRSSIQRWLDSGHNTCPATMQKREIDCVISSILFVLKQGSLSSRIATARVLEFIAMDSESKLYFAEHSDLLNELLRLVSSESDSDAMETGLSTLICISKPKRIRARLIQIGAVKLLAKLLSDSNLSVMANERVLKLLEMVSSCKGRRGGDERGRGLRGSDREEDVEGFGGGDGEHAVAILWSLCCVFRDSAVQEAVARSNGVTKILLLMQSDCSPAVRQMAGDLLKIFRVNSTSCLSSYDTKTTHISCPLLMEMDERVLIVCCIEKRERTL